jgi:Rieske 2Fe-2S family protein
MTASRNATGRADCPESGLLRPEEVDAARKPLLEASPLPPRIYNDPDVFAAEKARIFAREWLPAGTVDQVREVGDYFTIDILDEPLVVVRGEDDVIRTFYRVCRHRSMLVVEGAGNARTFECPYHCWTYDLKGRLTGAPEMHKTALAIDGVGLEEVRTEVWRGFVMINFDVDAEPLAPKLALIDEILEPWGPEQLRVAVERPYDGSWNWKIMIENGDAYHVMGIHRNSAQPTIPAQLSTIEPFEGRPYALYHLPFAEGKAPTHRPKLDGVPDWVYERLDFIFVWPCLSFSLNPDSITSYMTTPHGQDDITFTWRQHVAQETIDGPDFDKYRERVTAMFDLVHSEDEAACAGLRRGYASRGSIPSAYSHLDAIVWQFQQWYMDRMSA